MSRKGRETQDSSFPEQRHPQEEYDTQVYFVNGEMVERPVYEPMYQRQELEYEDTTCGYMCGAPAFEFGIWPFLPCIGAVVLSILFVWAYEILSGAEMYTARAFLVILLGAVLCCMGILALAVFTRKEMQDHALSKLKKNKPVKQVQGDESKRGYVVSSTRGPGAYGQRRTQRTKHENGSGLSMRGLLHRADTSNRESINPRKDEEAGYPCDDIEGQREEEELYPLEGYGDAPPFYLDEEAMQIIRDAICSKLLESVVLLGIVYAWILYSSLFSYAQSFLPGGANVGISIVVFVLVMTLYTQTWYDQVRIRYSFFGVILVLLLFVPTKTNVLGSSASFRMAHLARLGTFLVLYGLVQADTISKMAFWLRFKGKKRLLKQVSKLNMAPMGQVNTVAKQRIYVTQRIVFHSAYVLFLPWVAWPFAMIHIIYLMVSLKGTMNDNDDIIAKKFEDRPSFKGIVEEQLPSARSPPIQHPHQQASTSGLDTFSRASEPETPPLDRSQGTSQYREEPIRYSDVPCKRKPPLEGRPRQLTSRKPSAPSQRARYMGGPPRHSTQSRTRGMRPTRGFMGARGSSRIPRRPQSRARMNPEYPPPQENVDQDAFVQ